jgi:predicted AAA+ superfamily ATPase
LFFHQGLSKNKSRQEKLFIIFDEIQYLPKWEIHLKSLVDSYSAYQFIATGSAAAVLKLKRMPSQFYPLSLDPLIQ